MVTRLISRRDNERRRLARSGTAEVERPVEEGFMDDEGIEEDVMPQMMSIKPTVSSNGVSG